MRMQNADLHETSAVRPRRTVSELLRHDIDAFVVEFRRTSRLLRRTNQGELSPETLGRYLRSLHYLIRHTLIHLSLAEERARALGYTELAAHFAHKRIEEEGHDRWAEADMKRLAELFGVSVPDDPTPEMRVVVAANEKLIIDDPHAYLAYMLFAEYVTVAVGPEWLTSLAANCGIPSSVLTVIGKHIELDKEHVVEGCGEIDCLVCVWQADSLRQSLQGMTERFSAFFDGLCAAQA